MCWDLAKTVGANTLHLVCRALNASVIFVWNDRNQARKLTKQLFWTWIWLLEPLLVQDFPQTSPSVSPWDLVHLGSITAVSELRGEMSQEALSPRLLTAGPSSHLKMWDQWHLWQTCVSSLFALDKKSNTNQGCFSCSTGRVALITFCGLIRLWT